QFLSSIATLATLASEAVADFQLSGGQVAHQPQTADSSPGVATQVHNEPTAVVESGDSAINVFGNIDPDRAGKHRHLEKADFIGEHLSVNWLRRCYWMFLGLGHRQLKADS